MAASQPFQQRDGGDPTTQPYNTVGHAVILPMRHLQEVMDKVHRESKTAMQPGYVKNVPKHDGVNNPADARELAPLIGIRGEERNGMPIAITNINEWDPRVLEEVGEFLGMVQGHQVPNDQGYKPISYLADGAMSMRNVSKGLNPVMTSLVIDYPPANENYSQTWYRKNMEQSGQVPAVLRPLDLTLETERAKALIDQTGQRAVILAGSPQEAVFIDHFIQEKTVGKVIKAASPGETMDILVGYL